MTINDDDDKEEKIPVISDDVELLKRGICCVKIPERIDIDLWAKELSQLTPMILGFEGDGEYSFYRNIMDEPDFPFDRILFEEEEEQQKEQQSEESPSSSSSVVLQLSDIGKAMIRYFPIITQRQQQQEQEKEKEQHKDKQNRVKYLSEELQLDDAFCVHYNMDQEDTTGKKHIDPSDITINMCLQKSDETEGSYVLFYGTKKLLNVVDDVEENNEEEKEEEVQNNDDDDDDDDDDVVNDDDNDNDKKKRINEDNRFYVSQKPGYATIHFGDHTHETTALHHGSRTNIILTYVYTDQNRSDVATRTCY